MLREGNNSWYNFNKSSGENSLAADTFICFKTWRNTNIVSPWRDLSCPTSDNKVQGSLFVKAGRNTTEFFLYYLVTTIKPHYYKYDKRMSLICPRCHGSFCVVSPRVYAQWSPAPVQSCCALGPASWLENSLASTALHLLIFLLILLCLTSFLWPNLCWKS